MFRKSAALLSVMFVVISQPAFAQDTSTTQIDLRRVYTLADSAGGKPVLDTLPKLLNCPRYDPSKIRGDETTFSFERAPVVEQGPQVVRVTMEFIVNMDGQIDKKSIRVTENTHRDLSRSLEYWLPTCRYTAGKIGDQPVRVRLTERYEHRIQP